MNSTSTSAADSAEVVHDEDSGVERHRLGDLHELLLADPEVFDQHVRPDPRTQPVEEFARPLLLLLVVDVKCAVGDLASREDVLGDGQIAKQVELLEHHADAALHRFAGGAERHLLTFQQDAAMRRLLNTGDDLHQCRLAGAVLAHQNVDRAAPDLEIRAFDGDRPEIDLRDVLKLEDHVVRRLLHCAISEAAGVISGRSEPEPGT